MSSHIGVSCDLCSKTNFSGRRYKCLSCDNYDLCGLCYDNNVESQNHLNNHPMQCILTKAAYELFYAGESISYRTIVSLTCPYCGQSGFLLHTLLRHCLEKHSLISSDTNQVVMCPICVINPTQRHQSRFISLADHIVREHDEERTTLFLTGRHPDDKEDFDPDYEDEELPLYILAERLFTKEENRRQKLAQTMIQNENTTSQRRPPLSRHSAMRGSRGSIRGHFNNYPYGTVPRTTTGSFRIPFDTNIENSISSDPYTTILFSQDPLFGINFDSPFSDLTANPPFFLTSTVSTHIPSLQTATNDHVIQKKSNLTNTKQKHSNHTQSSKILTEPLTSDDQLWQQYFSTSLNNINSLLDTNNQTQNNNNNKINCSSINSENNSRSLLGKILKIDCNNEQTRIHSEQDHISFLQSLLLSSMNISINKE
ncbi:unnamed protein product [Adineta steineri]|uniref:RING-type E3 ubiquitin transferase n=1 Tax=Adineta steineri TaxID=433720 RepID=A0A814WXY9_9BILA|nr:unnamed protein product [Adineta steineri]